MKLSFATLAVCVSSLGIGMMAQSGSTAAAAATDTTITGKFAPGIPNPESAIIRVGGHNVRVEVSVYRNELPIIALAANNLAANLRISATDNRDLPPTSSVTLTLARRPSPDTWTPPLQSVPVLVYNPRQLFYYAAGGPRWPMNSTVTAIVTIRSGGQTVTASFPVKIYVIK